MEQKTFDVSKDKNLISLVKQFQEYCVMNDIPFYLSIAISEDGKHTRYANKGNLPSSMGINLSDDRYGRYLAVAAGFETIAKEQREDIDIEAGYDDLEEE